MNSYKVNLLFSDIKNINSVVANKLKYSKSYKIQNYFMEEVIDKIKRKPNTKYIYSYLYIDDLASYIRNKKLEKKIHYECIKKFLLFLKSKREKKIKVLVRPHPTDKNNKIKKIILNLQKQFSIDNVNIKFSHHSVEKDLNLSKTVVGSQSSVLLLSKKIGKPTYTCLQDKFLNKFASNSPLFKKIKV